MAEPRRFNKLHDGSRFVKCREGLVVGPLLRVDVAKCGKRDEAG